MSISWHERVFFRFSVLRHVHWIQHWRDERDLIDVYFYLALSRVLPVLPTTRDWFITQRIPMGEAPWRSVRISKDQATDLYDWIWFSFFGEWNQRHQQGDIHRQPPLRFSCHPSWLNVEFQAWVRVWVNMSELTTWSDWLTGKINEKSRSDSAPYVARYLEDGSEGQVELCLRQWIVWQTK